MNRKASVLLAFALLFVSASAGARGGIEAGYLNSNYNFKSDERADYSLNGFYVGVTQDVKLFAGLHIQPGLYYSYLTDKDRKEVLAFSLNGDLTDHYLSLPIMLRYQFGLPFMKIYVFGGPTLSVGLVSKQKYTVTGEFMGAMQNGNLTYDYYTGKLDLEALDVPADGDNPYESMTPDYRYKRFDLQLGAGVGIELFKFLEVKVGYDWGLLDRFAGDFDELRRNQFYASVGLRF